MNELDRLDKKIEDIKRLERDCEFAVYALVIGLLCGVGLLAFSLMSGV